METKRKQLVGRQRLYNREFKGRDDVVRWDVMPINSEQSIKITFISKNSSYRQGIRLAIDAGEGRLEINNLTDKSFILWYDTSPKEQLCKCITSEGFLSIYNIWDKGRGKQSQLASSGMLIEETETKRIYHCNDIGFNTPFDKLVFSIEKL